jgi:predicted ArsR family transcriptional regulator
VKTARQRILEYIRNHRAATVAELSLVLQTSPSNIRHHLSILQEQGAIEVIGERPADGKGRPMKVFALAERYLGNNLDLLTSALLEETLSNLAENERQKFYQRLAERMAQKIRTAAAPHPTGKGGDHLTRRLYETVQQLNAAHYQARWEARSDAPRLILGHCPYTAIIGHHPEFCKVDALLIEALLGEGVEHTQRLARDERGASYCRFRVRKFTRSMSDTSAPSQ